MLTGSNRTCLGPMSGSQYAAASGLGVPAQPPIERIGAAFDATAALVERVNRLVDRVAGMAPVMAGGSLNHPVQSGGVIPELVDRADATMSGISDANAALARLESLFGL